MKHSTASYVDYVEGINFIVTTNQHYEKYPMKQELLDYLNTELNTYKNLDKNIDINVHEFCKDRSALITNLITATEQAIFDLPSEEEIEEQSLKHFTAAFAKEGFIKGCNFILNYKHNDNT